MSRRFAMILMDNNSASAERDTLIKMMLKPISYTCLGDDIINDSSISDDYVKEYRAKL